MGRVVSPEGLLSKMTWPQNVSVGLTFQLNDTILTENKGIWKIEINNGRLEAIEKRTSNTEAPPIKLDIRHFSGILFGSYSLRTLYQYNLITIHKVSVEEVLKKWDFAFPCWSGFSLDYF